MDTSTDEHDLAKALDSVAAELDAQKAAKIDDSSKKGYAFSDPAATVVPAPGSEPVVLPNSPVAPSAVSAPITDPVVDEDTEVEELAAPVVEPVAPTVPSEDLVSTGDSELDSIKNDALTELRPLVDKLEVSPEEKFDTYLLLIRSTDDKALIAPAHEAAKAIEDESRRATALLDIIKEIDYLSKQK